MTVEKTRVVTSVGPAEDADRALLRRFEPILRFTRGEEFFPADVEPYVRNASLWMRRGRSDAVQIVPYGELTLENLGDPRPNGFNAVHFLKLTDPLTVTELASYRLQERRRRKDPRDVFHAGQGRLARVGYLSRLGDAAFSLSLLARGRVPGDTAAAAATIYQRILDDHRQFHYHGRVVRQDGWVVLQYWYFYFFNNWRTGFYGANDHEADWEMVSVYLAPTESGKLTPEWVAFASHDYAGDDLRRHWDDPELERVGEHPVVYVGAGSHASYYRAGEYLTELEVPFLTRASRMLERVQVVWHERLRQYRATADDDEPTPGVNLRIPFVDYARGDGLVIGPGQDVEWSEPRLLDPDCGWVSGYRGLWGYYARDPFSGEDAPAGPMYNRNGTVRRSWYDPIGWAGLNKVPPPKALLPIVEARQLAVTERQREALAAIEQKTKELRSLGVELAAMEGNPHLRQPYEAARARLAELSAEVDRLRAKSTADEALREALARFEADLRAGKRLPIRAHIRRPHQPVSERQLRAALLAELWAAISVSVMLIGFVALAYFARDYLVLGIVYALVIFIVIEAGFRGRITQVITGATLLLAGISAAILIYQFFWPIAVGVIVLLGLYILTANIRELRR